MIKVNGEGHNSSTAIMRLVEVFTSPVDESTLCLCLLLKEELVKAVLIAEHHQHTTKTIHHHLTPEDHGYIQHDQ